MKECMSFWPIWQRIPPSAEKPGQEEDDRGFSPVQAGPDPADGHPRDLDDTGFERSKPKGYLYRQTRFRLPHIDWTSPNCIPMEPAVFEALVTEAVELLERKSKLYVINRVVGADSTYALPITAYTDNALSALFLDNMFRPVPAEIDKSVFADKPFHLIGLPMDSPSGKGYGDKLRKLPSGAGSGIAVAMDFEKRIGLVYGSAYMGSLKKLIFTVMNYYLPDEGILPLHCSANEGPDGTSALFLGLSGTGKTISSADPDRALIGDDEHGWNDTGIANFEYGCYAKLIDLNPEKEPEIYRATFHADNYLDHGAIVENMMVYPNGSYDLCDSRFTENSRVSFPLSFLSNVKKSAVTGHPKTIIFLTADAYGVLPPISKLDPEQAMLWFMMGYTSKLAGTETGITEPQATFSRFFGEPFMPRLPVDYTTLLGKKLSKHGSSVFLLNTGWTGGAYGTGKRIDIKMTRRMAHAALNGELNSVEYRFDQIFKLSVPKTCPGIPDTILDPESTWADKAKFKETASKLAGQFAKQFEKAFAKTADPKLKAHCPGL